MGMSDTILKPGNKEIKKDRSVFKEFTVVWETVTSLKFIQLDEPI